MEMFYTIQGEGYNAGKAPYFIRLAGCDVGCVWCDVKESWEIGEEQWLTISDIVTRLKKEIGTCINVVITGGEPLMHNLDVLCAVLKKQGFHTWLETSGAYPLSGTWDWICLSPKKFKAPLPAMLAAAHELKVVVFNKSDLSWAEQHAGGVSTTCNLYLQPEWSKKEPMGALITEYVKQNPRWMVSVQTHKYLDIP